MFHAKTLGRIARLTIFAGLFGYSASAAEPGATASSLGWSGMAGANTAVADGDLLFASYAASTAKISKADLDALPTATGGDDWMCLSEALYFEARGESISGQIAVAEVILNRVESRKFPASVCGVVHQGGTGRYECQFTYHCDGRKELYSEPKAYARVGKIARIMLDGRERTLTEGAMYFHTDGVRPGWARRMTQTVEIGTHVFYRLPTRLTSN